MNISGLTMGASSTRFLYLFYFSLDDVILLVSFPEGLQR